MCVSSQIKGKFVDFDTINYFMIIAVQRTIIVSYCLSFFDSLSPYSVVPTVKNSCTLFYVFCFMFVFFSAVSMRLSILHIMTDDFP